MVRAPHNGKSYQIKLPHIFNLFTNIRKVESYQRLTSILCERTQRITTMKLIRKNPETYT